MATKKLQLMGLRLVNEEDYGKSAYEIALDNGFEGTEAEWLESLKGKDGADGKDGIDGKAGKDGIDGKAGKDGKDGEAGHTPIKGTDYYTPEERDELLSDLGSEITNRVGDITEIFSIVDELEVVHVDAYINHNGEVINLPGCITYRITLSPDELSQWVGKTIVVETYAYGDMAMSENQAGVYVTDYINPTADIANNPASGVCKTGFEIFGVSDNPVIFTFPFCENAYSSQPKVYVNKHSLWSEIKKLESVEGFNVLDVALTSVRYEKQVLTEAQKAQVRENIGAASVTDVGGSIIAKDDGNGNVEITMTCGLSVTDDGNGNVIIS